MTHFQGSRSGWDYEIFEEIENSEPIINVDVPAKTCPSDYFFTLVSSTFSFPCAGTQNTPKISDVQHPEARTLDQNHEKTSNKAIKFQLDVTSKMTQDSSFQKEDLHHLSSPNSAPITPTHSTGATFSVKPESTSIPLGTTLLGVTKPERVVPRRERNRLSAQASRAKHRKDLVESGVELEALRAENSRLRKMFELAASNDADRVLLEEITDRLLRKGRKWGSVGLVFLFKD
mmetsp:Transcript_19832/g.49288  ORF Transcript_19832/g.49288 Transcript_19832/m.49288 type:complete len:232 (-) Transcript_19832:539-1234(-)|eukprot:CAMPEP_0174884960 /NCGR_PEP_ID=MMETSP0167-20121228/361_1 /TAXON_ID=38298 /ORGANISM="Rhodella maculata, Strain CCMP736" /LENGTH=231 /DNA_ID=CAMNT_0016120453 /DNA_START=380 /DNA_END=1075 /DNA_ORIENTATION=+